MKLLRKQINEARPPLRVVNPLVADIMLIFGLVNLLMGGAMFFLPILPTTSILARLFGWDLWGTLYFLLGLVMLYGLCTNRWELMKKSMFAGVFLKAIWWVAIAINLTNAGSLIILGLWTAFAAIQISTYIHFVPTTLRRYYD